MQEVRLKRQHVDAASLQATKPSQLQRLQTAVQVPTLSAASVRSHLHDLLTAAAHLHLWPAAQLLGGVFMWHAGMQVLGKDVGHMGLHLGLLQYQLRQYEHSVPS